MVLILHQIQYLIVEQMFGVTDDVSLFVFVISSSGFARAHCQKSIATVNF